MATTINPSSGLKSQATHQRGIPAVRLRELPAARLAIAVETTAGLSNEVLTAVEEAQRAAIDATGRFLVSVELALPQEVEGTSEVAKKLTESGLEMADRLVHTWYDFLRKVMRARASTSRSVSGRNGAKAGAAQ
jgi:hypothetical protein